MLSIFLHCILHKVLSTQYSLKDHIVCSRPHQVHVDSDLLQMSAESSQRPLVPEVILLTILILDKFIILLVDRVVCQMHILVIFIYFGSISFTGKSCETLLEDVDSQRLIAGY